MNVRRPFLAPLLRLVLMLALGTVAASRGSAADEVYSKNCAPCHGVDGHARTPAGRKAGAKDFAESRLTEAEIVAVIQKGRVDKAGKPTMPAFGEKVGEDEAKRLAAVVIGFRKR